LAQERFDFPSLCRGALGRTHEQLGGEALLG